MGWSDHLGDMSRVMEYIEENINFDDVDLKTYPDRTDITLTFERDD